MAWSAEHLETLQTAYASGIKVVVYADGTSQTFRTLQEMERIIAKIERSLATKKPTTRLMRFVGNKGF
jgi:soluble cytochrome b562